MMSQVIAKRAAVSARPMVRSFASSTRMMADNNSEGATGAGKDAFGDREKAQENYYIKKHEAEQLKNLREKLEKQKEAINNLENEINNLKK